MKDRVLYECKFTDFSNLESLNLAWEFSQVSWSTVEISLIHSFNHPFILLFIHSNIFSYLLPALLPFGTSFPFLLCYFCISCLSPSSSPPFSPSPSRYHTSFSISFCTSFSLSTFFSIYLSTSYSISLYNSFSSTIDEYMGKLDGIYFVVLHI